MDIPNGATLIPLCGGHAAIADDAMADDLLRHSWRLCGRGYAVASIAGKSVSMASYVIGKVPGKEIDHINRNKLDNRSCNLRHATHSENIANSRRHRNENMPKGVSRCRGYYRASICKNGKDFELGSFNTAEEAARVYDSAARSLFGEFALTNS